MTNEYKYELESLTILFKAKCHDITEILLKMAVNNIILKMYLSYVLFWEILSHNFNWNLTILHYFQVYETASFVYRLGNSP